MTTFGARKKAKPYSQPHVGPYRRPLVGPYNQPPPCNFTGEY